jgi:uncharacterized protein (TIGR02421 family)
MSTAQYRATIKSLSDQLLILQKPIQILNAIKWPHELMKTFLSKGGTELPKIDRDYYMNQSLNFKPEALRQAFKDFKHDIIKKLGKHDAIGLILIATTNQYIQVIDLLCSRGTPEFLGYSQKLYGSARDHLRGDKKSLLELGVRLCEIFSLPAAKHLTRHYPKDIPAEVAVEKLTKMLSEFFEEGDVQVLITDGIVSDAAAGGDKIKINKNAYFSDLDLQVLEVHEGWVHVGTTFNGRLQPSATWLSVGSPRTTSTQEGLAVLIETLTFSSFPDRARRVSDRVIAIDMAEQGADFIEVYRNFVNHGISPHDSYTITQRVFRGGMVEGGACFTKDLSYVKGWVETVNFIRSAILEGVPEILTMLFVGKVSLDDIPVLYQNYLEGVIEPPRYLPPMFRELSGLYVWYGFASGLSLIDIRRVQNHFRKVFCTMPRVDPIIKPLPEDEDDEDDENDE